MRADDLGNLRSVDSPDSGLTIYDYDKAGNRTQQTDARDVVTSYAYDELNRPTAVTYPGDSSLNIDNGYDNEGIISPPPNGIGRLTSVDDVSGHTELQYDAFGELVLSSKHLAGPLSAWTFEMSYGYDDDGHVVEIGYPSGRTVDYVRTSWARQLRSRPRPCRELRPWHRTFNTSRLAR